MELFDPRPGAVPGLSLGRGRHRGRQRRSAAAVPRAGAVERPGPDPQGAVLRPDQRRGQPRRGRQGVLLLPRQHAHPLLHEHALQVPAGGVPLQRPGRHERRPRAAPSSSTSCSTRACSTATATVDVEVEYAKATPEDLLLRITVHNRGPEDARLHVLPTLWFRNTWSWPDAGRRPALRRCGAAGDGAHGPWSIRRRARRPVPALRGRRAAALHRERDEHASGSSARRTATPVRQGRHQRLRRARRGGRGQPGRTGTKVAAHYALDGRPAARRSRVSGCASTRRGPSDGGARALRRRLRRVLSPTRQAEADEFYADDPARRSTPTRRS